jgi:hypothetical protein
MFLSKVHRRTEIYWDRLIISKKEKKVLLAESFTTGYVLKLTDA